MTERLVIDDFMPASPKNNSREIISVVSRYSEVSRAVPFQKLLLKSRRGIETLFLFENWNGGFRVTKCLVHRALYFPGAIDGLTKSDWRRRGRSAEALTDTPDRVVFIVNLFRPI